MIPKFPCVLLAGLVGLASAGCASLSASPTTQATVRMGQRIAERDCAACHAVDQDDRSRQPSAPPLRDLNKRYDVEGLAEALAEGIVVGHASMPEKTYEPEEIRALIAYMKSLDAVSRLRR